MHTPLGPGAEFDLIRAFLRRSARSGGTLPPGVLVGPGDDCAVVRAGTLAASVDMAVEGVHFRRDWLAPQEIGYRSVAVALSDLAAMAAEPVGVLVAAAVPAVDAQEYILDVMAGAQESAQRCGTAILGGDVTRTDGPLVLDVAVLGRGERLVERRGALAGDRLWVTGRLGGAAAAVRAWEQGRPPADALRRAYTQPVPRLAEARWLAERGVLHALIDISDGLAGDAGHLAAASGVRIVLEHSAIPVHPAARATGGEGDGVRLALGGGDDYELCFAAAPGTVEDLAAAFDERFGLPLSCVGSITAGSGLVLRDPSGQESEAGYAGYDHFRERRS